MSDRIVRFNDQPWQDIEALPGPLRQAVHRTVFHLLQEPVPTLADPFPEDDPLPGAYRLHPPSDGMPIWYTVTPYEGQQVITIQYVKADT